MPRRWRGKTAEELPTCPYATWDWMERTATMAGNVRTCARPVVAGPDDFRPGLRSNKVSTDSEEREDEREHAARHDLRGAAGAEPEQGRLDVRADARIGRVLRYPGA